MLDNARGTAKIEATFEALRKEGRKAFIPFITAGDPDLRTTKELVLAMEQAGAHIIELGVPFSDPVADGPVIQAATSRALDGGTTLSSVLNLVQQLRQETDVPLVLMTYYNLLLAYGLEKFAQVGAEVGIDGVIIADLPVEEGDELRELLDPVGLALIPLVAPTSTKERLELIAEKARGFIYCVSLTGVTGERQDLPPDGEKLIQRMREVTSLPLALGFGISKPEQIPLIAQKADAVIVGSAIVKKIEENLNSKEKLLNETTDFVRQMVQALPQ
ncbi:tryptophan synthase subunit alpha [Heliorestis acidaminivorans]|uniref:Tryptophan synthase alpha chain n=1 Tax=Heliorestis acidaminivorans TaxID=553427 RepID=A0A6I0F6M9_9FIRM|nr:tryptophan synthase subunit alpha [Heliorestis acidaminivorans]KAB2954632.1 tryptophan synthase subunit alpha [Heliorestis acidaminivorans]